MLLLSIHLVAPEIDKSPTMLRAASNKGDKARLVCRVQSAPGPVFVWSRDERNINASQNGGKYAFEGRQIDPLTYESVLVIDRVEQNDYGVYKCRASNVQGSNSEGIRLEVTSKPDMPSNLNVLNTTHDSMTLSWTPGFDGGLKATYRIRYREVNAQRYTYVDSQPNAHKLIVEGLRTNTAYLVSIMAMNNLGESGWRPDTLKIQTKSE